MEIPRWHIAAPNDLQFLLGMESKQMESSYSLRLNETLESRTEGEKCISVEHLAAQQRTVTQIREVNKNERPRKHS